MTHHYYICRGSVLTKIQILCHFKKLLRLKKHICHLVTIPTMWAVGLLLSDRGAAAWCGFTMWAVVASAADPWCFLNKQAQPRKKELRPPGIIEPYKTYHVKQTLLKRGAILSDCTPRNNELIN